MDATRRGAPDRPNSAPGSQLSKQRRHHVGTRIAQLRTERGFATEQLAELAGLSRRELEDIESGRRGLVFERLLDVASALDVSGSELLDGMQ